MALLQYFGAASALAPWLSTTSPGEAFANLRQRNQFASLTSIGLVALLALFAALHMRKPSTTAAAAFVPLQIPAWAYASALVLALGNAASSSRTGLLQWVLILVLALFWNRGPRRPVAGLAAMALLLYGAAVLLLPTLLRWLTGISSAGLWVRLAETGGDSRRVLWANVLTLIAQKPWFGWGWGELDYAHVITAYAGPRFTELLDNAHNLPLHLAVELGIPAAVLIGLALAWTVRRAAPWLDTDPARQLAWAVLAVIGLHSLLEYPLWYGPFQLAVLLCVACLWRSRTSPQATAYWPPTDASTALISRQRRVLKALTAAAAWLVLAYVGFDYARVTQLYLPGDKRWPADVQARLGQVPESGMFEPQLDFASLLTTEVTPANASAMQTLALRVLHYSPEAKVLEKLIASALLAGHRADADFYLARFRWAYPRDCAVWLAANADLLAKPTGS
jgi:hypothetical protein